MFITTSTVSSLIASVTVTLWLSPAVLLLGTAALTATVPVVALTSGATLVQAAAALTAAVASMPPKPK
jgi:hypothetical protein